jgi:hypothetical protein
MVKDLRELLLLLLEVVGNAIEQQIIELMILKQNACAGTDYVLLISDQ